MGKHEEIKEKKPKKKKNKEIEEVELGNKIEFEESEEVRPNDKIDVEAEKKEKTKLSKKKKILIAFVVLAILIFSGVILKSTVFATKIKEEVVVELGTEEITISNFVTKDKYTEKASFVTDINSIDLTQVGEYEIEIMYSNKTYTVILKIEDTLSPEVEFQDLEEPINYEINAEDFIVSKTDQSEMTVEYQINDEIDTSQVGEYTVTVTVKDTYGNETTKECKLEITYIRTTLIIELGTEITVADIIFDEQYYYLITDEKIAEINGYEVGEYELITVLDEVEYTTKIIVQDTLPPELVLKEVTIYLGQTISGCEDFIESISDASEYTVNIISEIDYSSLGSIEVVIEATDIYENRTEQTAILNIVEDTDGPVFSGLSDMSVSKNATVDYTSGVTAVDGKDGTVEFSVDSSGVDLTTAGIYYITYSATDSSGNSTTEKRKIVVKSDTSDVYTLADNIIASLNMGSMSSSEKVLAIVKWVRTNVTYSSKYSSVRDVTTAAYNAFTKYEGECFGAASAVQVLLNRLGITNQMVHCTDYSHYWNLVYVDGVWRHVDGCSSNGNYPMTLMTDDERYESLQWYHARDWDRTAYPAAE